MSIHSFQHTTLPMPIDGLLKALGVYQKGAKLSVTELKAVCHEQIQ